MKSNLSLSKILVKLYEENSRYEIGPPVKITKDLEQNTLVLADFEISDEDIPVLCRFLHNKQVINQIERIEVIKSSGGKVNKRRTSSALNSHNFKLFKALLEFIERCPKLESVTFESVELPIEVLPHLGKSLVASTSDIRWLGFYSCSIGGDNGLLLLTPHLGRLGLQVLGLEHCELTDKSIPYIASILKAHENKLDSLYWNSTLRVDPSDDHGTQLANETNHVYSCGLSVLSLNGNKLTGEGILHIARVLRMNFWLLGLNFANNHLTAQHIATLVTELHSNVVLHVLLLKGNPGFSAGSALQLNEVLHRNTTSTVVVEDGQSRASGKMRLELLPDSVARLLRGWMRMQIKEVGTFLSAYRDPDESFLTISSAQSVKNRYQLPVSPSIRRKEANGLAEYSVFHFLEREAASPTSYKQAASPRSSLARSRQFDESFAVAALSNFSFDQSAVLRGENRDPLDRAVPSPPRMDSPLRSEAVLSQSRRYEQSEDDPAERQSWDNLAWRSTSHDAMPQPVNNEYRPPSRMSIRPSTERVLEVSHNGPPMHQTDRPPTRGGSTPRSLTRPKQASLPHYMRPREDSTDALRDWERRNSRSHRSRSVGRSSEVTVRRFESQPSPPRGRSAVFGKAPRDTRMRSRSNERLNTSVAPARYYRDHSDNILQKEQRQSRAPSQSRRKSRAQQAASTSLAYMAALDKHVQDLTMTMLHATQNLDHASRKLQSVSDSLNESLQLNMSAHTHRDSSFMQSFAQDGDDWNNRPSTAPPSMGIANRFSSPGAAERTSNGHSRVGVRSPGSVNGNYIGVDEGESIKSMVHRQQQSSQQSSQQLSNSSGGGGIADKTSPSELSDSALAAMVRKTLKSKLVEMLSHEEDM